MVSWNDARLAMAADRRRLAGVLGRRPGPLHAGLWALRLYRTAQWLRHGRNLKLPARLLWTANLVLTGADLDPSSPIGAGAVILDPRGVILYGTVGANCTFGVCSGIGTLLREEASSGDALGSMAKLGNNVVLGDRAFVLGVHKVGDDVIVGDSCVVMEDVPDGAVLVSRAGEWRAVRAKMTKRDLPEPARPGLVGCIRADVARAVLANGGSADVGAARFWGHLILPSVAGIAVFRIAQALHTRGFRRLGGMVAGLVRALCGMTLHPGSTIGPGLHVPHPVTVRFCGRAGDNLTLYPYASVGPETWPALTARPTPADIPMLGNDVGIGAGGAVVGPVTLGDGATVGVNAVVRRNLGAGLSAVPRRNWHYATVTVLPKTDNVEEMPALAVPRREAQA